MSVIQTIRSKYGKIAGAVIAVALVGFIISDARNGTWGNFFGGHDSNIMSVNGTKIDPKEYQQRLKEYEILYSMGRPLDDQTRAQMNEQLVQSIVFEVLADAQCDKLGIQEDDEKEIIYGENPSPMVRQFSVHGQQIFVNPQTNQFDPQIIKQFEKAITEEPQKYDADGKMREQWMAVKSYVKRMSRVNKFSALFIGGAYAPSYLIKRTFDDQNSIASVRYVKVPYTTVPDNDAKVTDDDIRAYMKKHEAMYATDQPERSIEYVSFDIIPSSADTARQLNALMQIKDDFAATKENQTFVNNKSDDNTSYSEAYLNKRTFTSREADTILSLPVGTVYGPYYENGSFRLAKIVDRKTLPDSVKVRHILVKTKDGSNDVMTDTAAGQRLDSAIAEINGGAKWDSVVARYSDDAGSKDKGGEYWFPLQQLPQIAKEFKEFVMEARVGEKKKVKVSNSNYSGYHYIEVLEEKTVGPTEQLAIVTKNLAPSDSTVNAIFGKANEFAGKNTTPAEFDASVKKLNLDKRVGENIKQNNFTITGLGPAREIIRWAFDHKVGDVSGVFQLGDQRYVVAKLVSAEKKGLLEITATNRPMLEQKVREEKKAEAISKKFAGSASLDAIASASGQQVQQSDSVILGASYVPALGYEPKVVGYAFCQTFQPNTVSPGIKGQGGVYFITVLKRTSNPVDPNAIQMVIAQQRYQQEGQARNAISQLLQPSLVKRASVKYNVDNF